MKVWLTEKSSVGKALAQVLGNPRGIPGQMHGRDTDDGRVLWAKGHVVSLAEPHDYDPKYQSWAVEHLPFFPSRWMFKVIEDAQPWYDCIERGMKGASEVIVATDAGREGEYIAWLILTHLGYKGPLRRLWTSGANEASLRKAIADLLPYERHGRLAIAAQIRAESDFIEGINLTRIFSEKFRPDGHDKPVSAGRVQTAVLALVVKRTREIENFKSQQYYEITAKMQGGGHDFEMHLRPPEDKRILDVAQARMIAQQIMGKSAPLGVNRQAMSQRPPTLFESSTLQIRAHNLWGWSAAKTEEISQSLYNTHKLISYPRTSGTHLEDDQVNEVEETLRNVSNMDMTRPVDLKGGAQFPDLSKMVPQEPLIRPEVFSSKLLQKSGADHHGIIPTTERPDLSSPPAAGSVSDVEGQLTQDERKLYLLVVRQYLAQFHEDCAYEQLTMSWTAGGHTLTASGRTILKPGWKTLFGEADSAADKDEKTVAEDEGDATLPRLPNGTIGTAAHASPIAKTTRAPKAFTEATLLAAMKNLATVIDDPETKRLLKDAGVLGTQTTWGTMLKKLKEREFVFVNKGQFAPSSLGRSLVEFCEKHVPQLVNPVSTARLEMMLRDVEQGLLDPNEARKTLQSRNIQSIRTCLDLPAFKLSPPEGNGGLRRAARAQDDTRQKRGHKPIVGEFVTLHVPFADKDKVKAMGAVFHGELSKWVMMKDRFPAFESEIREAGWLDEPKAA
ncbi:DNA topoisomerase [Sphingomonas sp. 3-13AW]|uniref:DNA topoisomerase n=1 Tax=Sphingomonas sp. 3-13AW TaxID=3050450 RepID=UPI003BB59517